jgi:hypothetical protein
MDSDAAATAPLVVASQRGSRMGFAHNKQAIVTAMMVSRGIARSAGSAKKPISRRIDALNTTSRSRVRSARAAAQPKAKHQATTGTE